MPPFTITHCTIDDGPALARNNMSAFWTDPTWVLLWRGKTLDYVITQASRRMPRNLLTDTTYRRHQKAIDEANSGAVVGYARWILPDGCSPTTTKKKKGSTVDEIIIWSEAQVPAVSEEREREAERDFAAADWNWDHALDELDTPFLQMKNQLMNGKKYLCLDYLAVHPDKRGQGIATMLVESGIKEAEKMGLDIFVLAFKVGLGVYRRMGFKLPDQIIQDDSKYGGKGEYGAYFLVKESKKQ